MLYDPNWAPPATEVKLEPWQKHLLNAADLIEKHGWTTGKMHDCNGAFCAMGAMAMAVHGGPVSRDPEAVNFGVANGLISVQFEFLDEHMKTFLRRTGRSDGPCGTHSSVWSWNDAPGRSKEEVVAVLREAAKG